MKIDEDNERKVKEAEEKRIADSNIVVAQTGPSRKLAQKFSIK